MIITAGPPGEQLCWSEPWMRFSARTRRWCSSRYWDARSAALIALVHALRCEHQIVDPRPYGLSKRQLRARAGNVAKGSWASEAVRTAITEIIAAVAATTAAAAAAGGANSAVCAAPRARQAPAGLDGQPGLRGERARPESSFPKTTLLVSELWLTPAPAPSWTATPRPPAREPLLPIRHLCPHRPFERAAAPRRCMPRWPARSHPLRQPPHRFPRRTTAARR